ncbi:glutamate receptor ionotropic, delta-2-like [Portunus trituberculatus]|uniref:glutamate receptor ionotropic, delta-2-like n=1 Tax=Portunus trituberculatus TaxID=210409 RepID=UPI001E1CE2DB|nr:glutamate receptor ionotropic, delta-2-like [Portunus trituberculatus]
MSIPPLQVSVVDNWPFFGLRKGVGGRVEADAGIDVSILNTLSQTLNFTYEVVLEEGGQWGGPQADGTVTGMIGMVARGEAHLAINEITITGARETVVDFTRPYFMESSACTSPAPKERSRAFAVLSPFTLQVWVSVGVSVMAVGLVLWVVSALTCHFHEKPTVTPLHDLTFNMYRSLVVQSNRLPALLWPLRLVFAGWYLYCFYVSALYSGTLTAVLALPVYEKPIDSLADLLEASKQGFYPVTIKEISIDFLFQKATSGVYHQIGRLMTTDKHYVDSPSNGIARVLQGPAVYIDARLSMEIQMIVQGKDNFYLGRQSFFPQTYGIACMKGADYRRHFDRVLERLVQSGLVEKYKRDEFLKLGGRITGVGGKRRGQTSAITITHLQGAFFLYVIGVTLALAVLVMEKILWQRFLK